MLYGGSRLCIVKYAERRNSSMYPPKSKKQKIVGTCELVKQRHVPTKIEKMKISGYMQKVKQQHVPSKIEKLKNSRYMRKSDAGACTLQN